MAMLSQRSLEAFHLVLECGSVSGAAEMMHISQPAVSRLIRDLEERTGLNLFTRFGGKIVPTPEARELAIEVGRSFIGLASIEQTAKEIRLGKRSSLSIASMPALATSLLPDTIEELLAQHPEFRVSLQSMQSHNVVRVVGMRQCQLGFSSPTRQEHDIDLIKTFDVPYVCIMPTGHPLGEKEQIGFGDMAGIKVVGYSENTSTGFLMERHLAGLEIAPNVMARSHLSNIISELVLRGLGISITDCFTARVHASKGGIVRPFECDTPFSFAIIRPRGMPVGPDLEHCLEIFDQQFERLRQEQIAQGLMLAEH